MCLRIVLIVLNTLKHNSILKDEGWSVGVIQYELATPESGIINLTTQTQTHTHTKTLVVVNLEREQTNCCWMPEESRLSKWRPIQFIHSAMYSLWPINLQHRVDGRRQCRIGRNSGGRWWIWCTSQYNPNKFILFAPFINSPLSIWHPVMGALEFHTRRANKTRQIQWQ